MASLGVELVVEGLGPRGLGDFNESLLLKFN